MKIMKITKAKQIVEVLLEDAGSKKRTEVDTMAQIKRDYGEHPITSRKGAKFCPKCDWIMTPPSYPGDYWDCTNPECGHSKASSVSDTATMRNPHR